MPEFNQVHDILRFSDPLLESIFMPTSIAVVGATDREGSVGRTILNNLIEGGFEGGGIFPVNPHRESLLGLKAYPDISSIPSNVDLAVVITPAPTVPGIIEECVKHGVRGAVIISAGFRETGEQGAALERDIMEIASRGKIRIIGPNCFGVMNPRIGMNTTFSKGIASRGNVAFITQSGALASAILDWSFREHVGYSAFVSVGSMMDVDWGDLIAYLGNDDETQSIILYMESIGDARSFLSAARAVSLTKPIIAIKPGRTEAASRAAASHTGALTGSDDVLDAAFRRSGVIRVNEISDLFNLAEILSKQPRPRGPRLTIVTNAGGPGVLATDALMLGGGELAELSQTAVEQLNAFLPTHWSHANPIDIIGDATPDRYAKTIEIVATEASSDGLLVILAPQAMTSPTEIAKELKPYAANPVKPLLASWMGGREVETGTAILNEARIPTFEYPDLAARMFNYMWRYTENLRGLYETPELSETVGSSARERAKTMLATIRQKGRTLLTEYESKQLLSLYGIPTVKTILAASEDEAAAQADAIGFPVVIKLHSETITHKTDVGGVRLNIRNANEARNAFRQIRASVIEKTNDASNFQAVTVQPMVSLEGYELILGSSQDAQFGPVLLFGAGGQLVEVFKDRSLALPPLTTTLARRMMEHTMIFKALGGVRGRKPVDLAALEQLVVRFSQMVVEQPAIKEIDINPLLASSEQLIALDARVILFEKNRAEADLPRSTIRPYPANYVTQWKASDGTNMIFRPIRPEDESLLVEFHRMLSERSVSLRFMEPVDLDERVSHERLSRICFPDYDREIPLVAESKDTNGEQVIMAVSRLTKDWSRKEGQLTILVADPFQHKGIGTKMIGLLIEIARKERLSRLKALITADNHAMLKLCRELGFVISESNATILAALDLSKPGY